MPDDAQVATRPPTAETATRSYDQPVESCPSPIPPNRSESDYDSESRPQPRIKSDKLLVEGGEDELEADAAAFGIRLPDAAKADDSLLVLPDNWPAVTLFCQCRTQWRYGPSGAPTGLDYASCYRVAKALEIDWQEQFAKLTVLEVETIRQVDRRSEG